MSFPARVAQHVAFRAAVAVAFLAVHVLSIARFEAIHWGLPWNLAPSDPPSFVDYDYVLGPDNWNRLAVSRWDSGSYIGMTLDDIYGHCPDRDLRGEDLTRLRTCSLSFYPGYSILGWIASLGARLPVDYALWGVSLCASFLLLFLWTGPVIVRALGVGGAYTSLLLLNVFTSGFTLVTALSEPVTMLCIFAAFLCLEKRRLLLGAVLAGAASGMRVTGLSAPLAFAAGVFVLGWDEDELSVKEWLRTVIALPLSAWGLLTMMGYHWWRFGDPFAYAHAHAQNFHHEPRFWHIFWPDAAWVTKSMNQGVHDVAVAALMLLWFALGHKKALHRFSRPGRVYWYAQTAIAFAIPLYGTAELGYGGTTRYMLLVFAGFFAMASVLRGHPAALAVWCSLSAWHYWNVDLCFFAQHLQPGGMEQCLSDTPPKESLYPMLHDRRHLWPREPREEEP